MTKILSNLQGDWTTLNMVNRFEILKKNKKRGSSAYSSSEGRKYYKNRRNFVNENKKNPCVKSYDLFVKVNKISSQTEDNKTSDYTALDYRPERVMTDLKSTKKKHFEGTQLKLREYQRLRNTDSDIFKNKKESEEISSERQEQRIKHIKHLAVKIQSYSKPTEIPIVYNTPTYNFKHYILLYLNSQSYDKSSIIRTDRTFKINLFYVV